MPVEVRAQAVEALQQRPVPPRLAAAEGSVAAAEGEAPRRAERRLEVQALRVRPGRARAQRRRQQQRQRRPRPAQRPHPRGRRRGPRSGRAALGSLARPRHGTARPAPRGSACPGLPPAPAAAEGGGVEGAAGGCGGAGGLGLHRCSRRREALAAWPALLRPSVVRGQAALRSCSGCSGAAPRAWPRRWMCPVRMPLGSGPCWPHHPKPASMKLPAPLPLCSTACPFGVLTPNALCCLFFASRVMFHISKHYNQVTSRHVWGFFSLLFFTAASHSGRCISILRCRVSIKDKECRVHADMLFLTPALRLKDCCTVHMGCKITAWLGTSCQETICVTAFNKSLFFSPYAYVTATKVTKNFAYVQATRIPDDRTSEFSTFLFLSLKITKNKNKLKKKKTHFFHG